MKKIFQIILGLTLVFFVHGFAYAGFYDDKDFDGSDMVTFLTTLGSTTGSPKYSIDTDFNKDGVIDSQDLSVMASIFGSTDCMIPILSDPGITVPILSLIPSEIYIPTCYAGDKFLTFTLEQGPEGMSIDLRNSNLTWTPPKTMEGSSSLIRVRVTDGVSIDEIEFNMQVAISTPVATVTNGNTTTVTEVGNLQGLSITLPDQPVEALNKSTNIVILNNVGDLEISTFEENQVPPIPNGVTKLIGFFRSTPINSENTDIIIKFPDITLPNGRYPFELTLYTYNKTESNTGVEIYGWVPSQLNLNLDENGIATVETGGLGGVSFIGISTQSTSTSSTSVPTRSTINGVDITCMPKLWLLPNPNIPPIPPLYAIYEEDYQICTVDGNSQFECKIRNIDDNNWDGTTDVHELAYWVYATQNYFDALNLRYDMKVEVQIEQLDHKSPTWIGYVTAGLIENRKVIHLDLDNWTKEIIQSNISHEYFHQAQSRTNVSGLDNIMKQKLEKKWLSEGTARWFEDYQYDDINSYLILEPNAYQIMKAGFNSIDGPLYKKSYARFAMWKLIEKSCGGFNLQDILNVDLSNDPSGIINLSNRLESPIWDCYFGNGFGFDNANTLPSALLYYQYATQLKDDIALLDTEIDPNKNGYEDKGKYPFPSPSVIHPEYHPYKLKDIGVPANGARSYKILPIEQLTNEEVFISVEVIGGNALVSLMKTSADINDPDNIYFDTAVLSEYIYARNENCPEMFLTIVNPSLTEDIEVKVVFGVRPLIKTAIFSEDWETGAIDPNKWGYGCDSYPECSSGDIPIIYSPGLNSNYALNHNGGGNCHSASHTVQWFSTVDGLEAEFWLDPYDLYGYNSSNRAGFTEMELNDNPYCTGDNWYYLIAGVQINLLHKIIVYGVWGNVNESFTEDLPDTDWHKFNIVINKNGIVNFYRDGLHKFVTDNPLDLSNITETKFQHYGQATYFPSQTDEGMLIDSVTVWSLE